MSLHRYHEILLFFIILLTFLIGFLGPTYWWMTQPLFKFKAIQNHFDNDIVRIDKLNKFYSNKNYLSSDKFNNKTEVFKWSEIILKNVKNNIPIPRMYFPYIPKNINEYEIDKKKLLL